MASALGPVTTSRPPLVPVDLCVLAADRLHHPVRRTPLHHWHEAAGAKWLDAGQWKRPESYGDPEAAFAAAAHRIAITTRYPRNAGTPLETFVVLVEYLPGEDAYEITANFQGPLAMHPVMALALGVPANRLRLRTPPDSGGSFGAKHAVFPHIVSWKTSQAPARSITFAFSLTMNATCSGRSGGWVNFGAAIMSATPAARACMTPPAA